MGFLAPWFLAGLALAALPLWLHLLRQFKRTPLPFSSLMFFERRLQSSTHHRRLRYLTLLSLRLLLLLLLVLAFANPFVTRRSPAARGRTLSVLAIDRSFSMRAGGHLERAKEQARAVVDHLGGQQMAEVLAFDSHVESLTGLERNHQALIAAVNTIAPSDLNSSYAELARALRVLAETKAMQLQVHLFSDVQQTSMPPNFRDLQLGSGTSLQIHESSNANRPNWAVESVNTEPRIFDTRNTRLDATVAGWQTEAGTKTVTLLLDGKPVASKDVSIPAHGRTPVQFLGFDVPYGAHRGTVEITPGDSLPADDRFPFAIERSDPRHVLFLYAGGRNRGAFYYKAALEASTETGLRVDPFAVEQIRDRDLSPYAFVVLNDTGDLDPQVTQKLCSFVQSGGAALIVVGPATVRSGKLPLSNLRITTATQTQGIGMVDDQNPALAGAGHFQNVQFYSSPRINFKAGANVLAKFADGTPLLTELPMSEGRALIFASSLDNTASDFPLHSAYLPFVAQTARYLSGAEDSVSSVVAGSPVSLRRTPQDKTAADITGPGGKHELSLEQATNALSFDVTQEGFYEIGRAGRERKLIAVHADRRESDLAPVPDETLELWRNTGSAGASSPNGAPAVDVQPETFWRYLLILALVAALADSIYGSRFLKKEGGTV